MIGVARLAVDRNISTVFEAEHALERRKVSHVTSEWVNYTIRHPRSTGSEGEGEKIVGENVAS